MRAMASIFLLAVTTLCTPGAAIAKIKPSFQFVECSWLASDVIVVSMVSPSNGEVEVMEVWSGELEKGNRLTFPELTFLSSDKARKVFHLPGKDQEDTENVSCQRMVLFLWRTESLNRTIWKPVCSNGFRYSMAWVEKGRVFAQSQSINPGPSRISSRQISENEMRTRYQALCRTKNGLSLVLANPCRVCRFRGVVKQLQSDNVCRGMILRTVVENGATGCDVIRDILADKALISYHADALTSLEYGERNLIVPVLNESLNRDLSYWEGILPKLCKGWISNENGTNTRLGYERLLRCLEMVRLREVDECFINVARVRALWISETILNEECKDIRVECDIIMSAFLNR